MSESEGFEAVTVSEQGVTVTKRFEADEFPVPAIAFEFVSDRDETVHLTLKDDVPEGVEVEDLGFHPEYGSEFWTIDEAEITFEREFAANSEYTTVYGIRATGTDDVGRFLDPPSITAVDPPLSDGSGDATSDVLSSDGEDVVRDVISGEADVPPGLEDDDAVEDDEDVETLELNDPEDAEGTVSGDSATDESGSAGDSGPAGGAESIVSALATELRNGDVAMEDVKLLREALEIAGERGGSVTARVDRIQQDVADLRAYTDALESFLDENGTAEEVVEGFRADVGALQETLEDLETTVDAHEDSLRSIEAELSSVQESVEAVESSLSSLESDVNAVEDELGEDGVARRVEELAEDLDDLQSWQTQIKRTFGGE